MAVTSAPAIGDPASSTTTPVTSMGAAAYVASNAASVASKRYAASASPAASEAPIAAHAHSHRDVNVGMTSLLAMNAPGLLGPAPGRPTSREDDEARAELRRGRSITCKIA